MTTRPFALYEASALRERGYQDGLEGRSKIEGMSMAREKAGEEGVAAYMVGWRRGDEERRNAA